jgi:metal-sulfur cluster biosynthetic enzyme
MAKNISEQDARKAIAEVRHPAIDCTLVELGIVKDVKVKSDKVVVIIAFPVPNIPIRDMIINSVKEPIANLGAECEIKETIMTSKEREAFLDKEQKNWKGNM